MYMLRTVALQSEKVVENARALEQQSGLADKKTGILLEGNIPVLFGHKIFYFTTTEVMWGFTPLYQYRKPSISTVWPISRALTAWYTSVSGPHR